MQHDFMVTLRDKVNPHDYVRYDLLSFLMLQSKYSSLAYSFPKNGTTLTLDYNTLLWHHHYNSKRC